MIEDGITEERPGRATALGEQRRSDGRVRRRLHHEWGEHELCQTIVTAVAAADGTDPMRLSPLYDVVDTEALEQLFRGVDGSRANDGLRVGFEYEGHVVAVHGDGTVVVRGVGDAGDGDPTAEPAGGE